MSQKVLEEFIRQYIESQEAHEVLFAWQGGEPTLLGVDFFQTAINLQRKYAGGKRISNTIQTNGTLLTEEWCSFFKKYDFLVGVSVDGPRELHDYYRVRRNGQPTFDEVISGIGKLKEHGVAFNTLTVLNARNSCNPLAVYRFLKEISDGHMQFIPVVERMPGKSSRELGLELGMPPSDMLPAEKLHVTPWSVTPEGVASFYITIFNEWIRNDVGRFFVQFFDVALGNWLGAGSGLCHFSPQCGLAGALEYNGDLYSCDHYVYPGHKLGNLMETPLTELMLSDQQRCFGEAKQNGLTKYCKDCEVLFACHGDCPKHRFEQTPNGEPRLSYLCSAYKRIFTYMAPYMKVMAQLVRMGRPAPEVMEIVCQHEAGSPSRKPGRNEVCPCGSGKKYKKCCSPYVV